MQYMFACVTDSLHVRSEPEDGWFIRDNAESPLDNRAGDDGIVAVPKARDRSCTIALQSPSGHNDSRFFHGKLELLDGKAGFREELSRKGKCSDNLVDPLSENADILENIADTGDPRLDSLMERENLFCGQDLPRYADGGVLENHGYALDPEEFSGNPAHAALLELRGEEEHGLLAAGNARRVRRVEIEQPVPALLSVIGIHPQYAEHLPRGIENANRLRRLHRAFEAKMDAADHGRVLRIEECPLCNG